MADVTPEFELVVRNSPSQVTVVVVGDVDSSTSARLRDLLTDLIDDGARQITLDVGGLAFIDSSGLGVIVGAMRKVRLHGGDLELAAVNPNTTKVLEITGLDRVLTIR